ncbi:MAG: HD domain-containing protein [Candidatus Saganbacteria bacterium]|nr:HD domain-containing protein [Candidatus Saganbacteria bacterium]
MTVRITKKPYVPPRITTLTKDQLLTAGQLYFGFSANLNRGTLELRERLLLSEHAWPSARSLGRQQPITEDSRTIYARDCDRILYMKHFAALAGKTQVLSFPRSPLIHNRRFHVDKVAGVARDIGRRLGLNEDLIEAISKGHDLGHPPFGHDGEKALSRHAQRLLGQPFRHNRHSLRVVDVLENKNLTAEVRNGILCHCGEQLDEVLKPGKVPADPSRMSDAEMPYTLEGCVVRSTDIIVYLAHDYLDALNMSIVKPEDLPVVVQQVLGTDPDDMIGIMVADLVAASRGKHYITLSDRMLEARQAFFRFDYERIIGSELVQSACAFIPDIIDTLFDYYNAHLGHDPQSTIDRIASLTDRQARDKYNEIRRKRTAE